MNNLKKTLALVAALAMTATAFASCGDDESSSSSSKKESSNVEESSEGESSEGESSEEASGGMKDSVGQGGDTVTIASWDHNDVPALIANWKGLDFSTIGADLAEGKVDGVDFIDLNCGGGDAAEKYDQLFLDGGDLDIYFCEADWALKFIDSDNTLPLSDLGLTDADFPNIYAYTDVIGKDSNGVRKGISWQAAAGGFGYNAELAEQYLGVKSPEEMQAKVADWDKFVKTAEELNQASGGSVALADSLGGLWQAYACGRSTPWVVDNTLQVDAFCEDFAKTAKALWDIDGVAKNGQWNTDWTSAGVTGNTLGYFVSTWGFSGFFMDAAGGVDGAQYGKWNVCRGPVSYYWGGTWIVVNPKTDNGNEARDFIVACTSDEASMENYAINKPEYVNNKKIMDKLIAADTQFNPEVSGNMKDGQNYFKEICQNIDSLDFNGLITPYDATIKQAFTDAIEKEMLIGGKSYEDAVTAFEDKVLEAIPEIELPE